MNISEFYCGKKVLITGGTGFLGKCLVWKLLNDLNVNRIYVLVRSKRDVSPIGRYSAFINHIIFNEMRDKTPERLQKIQFIKGDISIDELDLSQQDRRELIENVNVIFHCAACVKFDFPLKIAVNIQLSGTLRMLKLAEDMKNLHGFTYISTAFTQQTKLEEKHYPAFVKPLDIIHLMNMGLEDSTIECLSAEFLKRGHPNTYTLTKSFAEDLVHSYRDKFKITIVRPSIILGAISEPFPGWIESYSGPASLIVGMYNGILRTILCDKEKLIKFIPIDVVVNATIVATCKRTMMSTMDVFYCNITDSPKNVMSWKFFIATLAKYMHDHPLKTTLWYPNASGVSNVLMYHCLTIFKQFLPCYLFDMIGIAGKEIKLIEIQKKLYNVMVSGFKYFTKNNFDFKTDNFTKLNSEMSSYDQQKFNCDVETIDLEEYMKDYLIGVKHFLLKEGPEKLPAAKLKHKWLYFLHIMMCIFDYCVPFYIISRIFKLLSLSNVSVLSRHL